VRFVWYGEERGDGERKGGEGSVWIEEAMRPVWRWVWKLLEDAGACPRNLEAQPRWSCHDSRDVSRDENGNEIFRMDRFFIL
jgi:hypothetical protein